MLLTERLFQRPSTRLGAAVTLAASATVLGCSSDEAPNSASSSSSSALVRGSSADGALPAQSSRPRARRGKASLPDLTQVDVLASRSIAVRVSGQRGRSRVSVFYRSSSGRHVEAGSARASLRGGVRTVRVPIGAGARRALTGCERRSVVATVKPVEGSGPTLRARGRMFVHPPGCARFFGPDSVWNRPLPDDMPLDQTSSRLVAKLREQVESARPTININSYSTAVYTVPADQKRVRFTVERTESFAARVKAQFSDGVPVPDGARPSAGSDGQLTIWQPSTDTIWELYKAQRAGDGWRGTWGAVMRNVSENPGVYPRQPSGATISTTASGLPLVGGLVTLEDVRRGRIDHALQMAVPKARRSVWSLPARITDGADSGPDSIPEGARFRLPSDLDIDALGLPPLTRMLARAAQRYGIIVSDQAGAVSFRGEQSEPGDETWSKALGGKPGYEVIGRFPFERLQLTEMALGGPSVKRDHVLKDGSRTTISPEQRRPPRCHYYGICALFEDE